MYTALICPCYADGIEQEAKRHGGFVARGLMAHHPAQPDATSNWVFALLPGEPPEAGEVIPLAADDVIRSLEAERERYQVMARQHPDTLWQEAIRALDEMLDRLYRNQTHAYQPPVAQTA